AKPARPSRPARPARTGRVPPPRGRRRKKRAGKVRSLRREFPMIRVRCPICQRVMQGQTTREWPEFPFCSPRCKLVDLGRWLGENYRIPSETPNEETAPERDDLSEPP